METCPSCEKGFITYQPGEKQRTFYLESKTIKVIYDRDYRFCSNVLCSWRFDKEIEKSRIESLRKR